MVSNLPFILSRPSLSLIFNGYVFCALLIQVGQVSDFRKPAFDVHLMLVCNVRRGIEDGTIRICGLVLLI